MSEPNYQRIAESLVENAKNSGQVQSLDHQTVVDSVERLCESPEGARVFVEATAKIDQQTTKSKLIASLNWVNGTYITDTVVKESRLEMIKPFQLAAIGLTVAELLWIVQNPPASGFHLYFFSTSVFYVLILTTARKFMSDVKDQNKRKSVRTVSLLDIVQNVDVSLNRPTES